jgi:tripartite-type tricarboxylate transporter receptor subunit TctC
MTASSILSSRSGISKGLLHWALIVFLVPATSLPSIGQQYPTKPIRIIVPFAPGGGVDFMARLMAQKLADPVGQIVVDNRPGAGGTVGTEIGVKSPADGYTLTMISSSYPVLPSLYKLSFDPIGDISPIILVAKTPFIVAVHPSLPVKTTRELIAFAKSKPGQINFASAGTGSGVHLATELFMYQAGIKMNHIPYKGTGPALTDTIAGQATLLFGSVAATLPYVKSERLRAIAVTSAQRMSADPSIPTVAESGLPGYEVLDWDALIGPKALSRQIVDRVNSEVKKVLAQKDVENRFLHEGLSAGGGTPEQLLDMIRKEMEMWRKVIAEAGIKVN